MIINEEHIDLTTIDKCIEAIKSGNIGGYKVLPQWKDEVQENTNHAKMLIQVIFSNMGDNPKIRTGVLMLIFSKVTPGSSVKVNIKKFYEYYAKDNFKKSAEFQEFLKNGGDERLNKAIETFEKNSVKKAKKSEVKQLYPTSGKYDKDGWQLVIPLSFEGEKAAAFYGKEGEVATATHWCTRAEEGHYSTYTSNNTHPLYIIRNYKTGKAYQVGFVKDEGWDTEIEVHFLDQNDENGDKLTAGDISSLPDELCKQIKIWRKDGKTLLDYKKADGIKPDDEVSAIKYGKIESHGESRRRKLREIGHTTWSKPIAVKDVEGLMNEYFENKMVDNDIVEKIKKACKDGISYIYSKGAVEAPFRTGAFDRFYDSGVKKVQTNYPEACIRRYYFNSDPKHYVSTLYPMKYRNVDEGVNTLGMMGVDGPLVIFLRDTVFNIENNRRESKREEETDRIIINGEKWITLNNKMNEDYKEEMKKLGVEKMVFGQGAISMRMPWRSDIEPIDSLFSVVFRGNGDRVMFKSPTGNFDNITATEELPQEYTDFARKVIKVYLKRFIKIFKNELIKIRSNNDFLEGGKILDKNMYEEVNYKEVNYKDFNY